MADMTGFMSNPYGPSPNGDIYTRLAMSMDPMAAANQLGPLMGNAPMGSNQAMLNQGWDNMIYGAPPTSPQAGPQGQPFQMNPQTAQVLNGMVPRQPVPYPGGVAPRVPQMGNMIMQQGFAPPQAYSPFANMVGRR